MALVDPLDVDVILGATATDPSLVTALIGQVTGEVAGYLGHEFDLHTDAVMLQGYPGDELQLPGIPVVSVASVTVDGCLLDVGAYRVTGRSLLRRCGWGDRMTVIDAVYTWGFATAPDWVASMLTAAVASAYSAELARRSIAADIAAAATGGGSVQSKQIGATSIGFAPISGTRTDAARRTGAGFAILSPADLRRLDRYRRTSWDPHVGTVS